jgi:tryptophan synthase
MSSVDRLKGAFAARNAAGKPAFVAFLTAGYPTLASTVPSMLTLQAAGCDVIEVGVAFSDPLADGGTIAKASEGALANGVSLAWTLQAVRDARAAGLTVPVVLMGYINPVLAYGQARLVADAAAAGVDGFIVVDLLPEDAGSFLALCGAAGLAFVPLVAPTTPDARLPLIAAAASAFVYCVSVTGVTGARTELPPDLADFLRRVRAHVKLPLAVGFGLSTPAHVAAVGGLAEGVVMGSAIVRAMEEGPAALEKLLKEVVPPR